MIDSGEVAGAVLPYLTAVAGLYGTSVARQIGDQAGDATVDATVGLGRRILRRLLTTARSTEVEGALIEMVEDPQNMDRAEALRTQVVQALIENPELTSDIMSLLSAAAGRVDFAVRINDSQGVQVGNQNVQNNTFGRTSQ